jgi:putative tricarboxylic transport membrane protein
MALDRWIALAFLALCGAYGYAAFFTMDQLLPPFMQRNPVWPSSFPKVLSILGAVVAVIVLLGLEKPATDNGKAAEIDYRRLHEYKLGQALGLLAMMVGYALLLRPLGFLLATTAFLAGGGALLGERKFHFLIPIAAVAAGAVWYLVEVVLGIFLRPYPWFV